MISVCIARQFGSGGRAIGQLLSQKLGFSYYDNALIDLAAKQSNMTLEQIKKADEAGLNPWQYAPTYSEIFSDTFIGSDTSNLFKLQSKIIKKLALDDNAVFVGRAADYVLDELAGKIKNISIFITAPFEWRVKRLMETEGFKTERETLSAMKKKDRQRKNYYNYYTGRDFYDPSNYDLIVNSSFLGIEKSADFLAEYVKFVMNN